MQTRPVLIALALTLLAGCTPQITRRYAEPRTPSGAPAGQVMVSVSRVPGPPKPSGRPLTVADLPERAQAALIREVRQQSPNDDILKIYTKELEASKRPSFIDATTFKCQLVIALDKANALADGDPKTLADRIDRADIVLATGRNSAFRVVTCDKLVTEFEDADLGSIAMEQAASGSVKLNPDLLGDIAGKAEAAGVASQKLTETLALKRRLVKMSAMLQADRVTIIREGEAGRDLTGNTILEVTLKTDGFETPVLRFADLYASGAPSAPSAVGVSSAILLLPDFARLPDELALDVGGRYRLRHVIYGHATLMEGDDTVEYWLGKLKATRPSVVVLSKAELADLSDTYYVAFAPGHEVGVNIRNRVLTDFESFEEALAFKQWLQSNATPTVGQQSLPIQVGNNPINSLDANNNPRYNRGTLEVRSRVADILAARAVRPRVLPPIPPAVAPPAAAPLMAPAQPAAPAGNR